MRRASGFDSFASRVDGDAIAALEDAVNERRACTVPSLHLSCRTVFRGPAVTALLDTLAEIRLSLR